MAYTATWYQWSHEFDGFQIHDVLRKDYSRGESQALIFALFITCKTSALYIIIPWIHVCMWHPSWATGTFWCEPIHGWTSATYFTAAPHRSSEAPLDFPVKTEAAQYRSPVQKHSIFNTGSHLVAWALVQLRPTVVPVWAEKVGLMEVVLCLPCCWCFPHWLSHIDQFPPAEGRSLS